MTSTHTPPFQKFIVATDNYNQVIDPKKASVVECYYNVKAKTYHAQDGRVFNEFIECWSSPADKAIGYRVVHRDPKNFYRLTIERLYTADNPTAQAMLQANLD